mmetsp:Transcript_6824/g.18932  ORF Transcript_6824/g.18932 Transcript_6824/m.18932 type:complete len:329 (-) Transcript_6824:1574-2560(-)
MPSCHKIIKVIGAITHRGALPPSRSLTRISGVADYRSRLPSFASGHGRIRDGLPDGRGRAAGAQALQLCVRLLGCRSQFRFVQGHSAEELRVLRQFPIHVLWQCLTLTEGLLYHGTLHDGAKRRAEELQDHEARREDVRRCRCMHALGRTIARGPHLAAYLVGLVAGTASEPEVANLQDVVERDKEVLGLHIAVHQVRGVYPTDALHQVLGEGQLQRLPLAAAREVRWLGVPAARGVEPRSQCRACAQLHLDHEHRPKPGRLIHSSGNCCESREVCHHARACTLLALVVGLGPSRDSGNVACGVAYAAVLVAALLFEADGTGGAGVDA